jgi:hypothetical protein
VVTVAPSPAIAATAAGWTPAGTKIRAASPRSVASRATARPWLPSVAATSAVTLSAPSDSARSTAQDAPRILNAGRPNRSDSSFTSTRLTPNSVASSGASTSGVGR